MTPPTTPFWFKQRQCKAEPQPGEVLKLSGPNLTDAYIYARPEGERWRVGLRLAPNGEDVARADLEQPTPRRAWEAAFELYRTHLIV
jgi:hypothetical protein